MDNYLLGEEETMDRGAGEQSTEDAPSGDELQALWKLHELAQDDKRFLAEQRAKLTHCILILATAALALLKLGTVSTHQATLIALFLFGVGVLGALLTFEVSKACGESSLCEAIYLNQIKTRHPRIEIRPKDEEPPNYWRWMAVHFAISVAGIFVYIFCRSG